MKKRKVYCSMIEIEREYYPDTFNERRKKLNKDAFKKVGVSMAHIAIEEVKSDLKELENFC